ncbi:hypothetical protein [Persicirhabdus sediminis]|uniref:Uncharacterized protein n=1 Tax=Persicirhabdus sediminis TaxID=454144 RepID=A0A8J7MFC4_9BACT|nr:hypothetical protein [Persicirhabdus sediminis]MBK1791982.1 hypothetical protein [Persicirhabdus sediminis]
MIMDVSFSPKEGSPAISTNQLVEKIQNNSVDAQLEPASGDQPAVLKLTDHASSFHFTETDGAVSLILLKFALTDPIEKIDKAVYILTQNGFVDDSEADFI